MKINDKPCGECDHFDPVLRGRKPTKWGWCAKKSLYPYAEGPGQLFPEGVTRVGKDEQLAKPFIVELERVVSNCSDRKAKSVKRSKQDLINQLHTTKSGKIVQR